MNRLHTLDVEVTFVFQWVGQQIVFKSVFQVDDSVPDRMICREPQNRWDFLGRDINSKNGFYLEIYSDGSVLKRDHLMTLFYLYAASNTDQSSYFVKIAD